MHHLIQLPVKRTITIQTLSSDHERKNVHVGLSNLPTPNNIIINLNSEQCVSWRMRNLSVLSFPVGLSDTSDGVRLQHVRDMLMC